MQVATVNTPATAAQVLGALQWAIGGNPPQVALAIIASQSGVETADWHSMHNWNVGNITPTAQQAATGPWMDQGLHGMKYIAYGSLAAGAAGMVGWLVRKGLMPYAIAGDLNGYSARLQATCYLGCVGNTDPLGHTVTVLDYVNYQAGMQARIPKLLRTPPAVFAPSSRSNAGLWVFGAALAGGGALIYREARR